MLCSTKFLEDHFLANADYAKLVGITLEEINSSEIDFLFSLISDFTHA